MKKAIYIPILALILMSAGCDNRPPGAYDYGILKDPVNVKRVEYNGIKYLNFDIVADESDGWCVDHSQFFVEDTLIVNGQVWVRQGTEEEVKKHQRVPEKEDGDG